MASFSVVEHNLISSPRVCRDPRPEVVLIPDEAFDALRQLAYEDSEIDGLLTLFVQKGSEYARVRNYVGLLVLPDGTQLEIVPRVRPGGNARSVLLTMLRYLRHSPFRTFSNAHTEATPFPLWDVFITAFLDTIDQLVRQGIQRAYVSVAGNERFWKGKFQTARQQRENLFHAERLAVTYDALTTDVPPNRLLKTTLLFLQPRTTNPVRQRRIRELLAVLDDVTTSVSIADDLKVARRNNRLYGRYEPALDWAEALLGARAFGLKTGRVGGTALLFPIERVFESYVAQGVRRYWPDGGEVSVQESSAHLVDEHGGLPKFKLRPDILIRQGARALILDTKWKLINRSDRIGNYGIEQADLYQLYAYGKKYAADDLFLVYPASETFLQPLPAFGYDADTRLHVVPFDVTTPLPQEVEKLVCYALSVQRAPAD